MSNTITLTRGDWNMVTYILDVFMNDHNIRGGSLDCILVNINNQLDNQEY